MRRTLRQAQAPVDQIYLAAGVKSINEVRAEQGLAPVQGGEAPLLSTGTGIVPLAQAAKGQPSTTPSPSHASRGSLPLSPAGEGRGEGPSPLVGEGGASAPGEGSTPHQPVAKYAPDQPRVPAGNTGGGQWTSEGGGDASTTAGEVRADTHTADPHADDRQKPIQVADSGQIATDTGIQLAGNDDVIPGPETPMGQNPLDPAEIHKPLTPERKQAVADTIQKIMDGNVSDLSPHPYKNLPSFNTGARLPTSSTGYVTYYVPPDPSGSDMSRIVVEVGTGRMYYTGDHYDSFIPINIQRIH